MKIPGKIPNRKPRQNTNKKKKPVTKKNVHTKRSMSTKVDTAALAKQAASGIFAKAKIQIQNESPSKLSVGTQEEADLLFNTLSKGSQASIIGASERKVTPNQIPKDITRPGFEPHLVHDGLNPTKATHVQNPEASVFVLPASSKIARKYIDDIRSGKIVEQMYKDFTKAEQQPVYTPSHTYVHHFRVHERNHRDFLKRLGLIEAKLTQRFGSTYYLHASKSIRKFRKRFTILRSPFVHKKAQDQYEYNHNEYLCRVSYAFAITDPVINDFIYEQLKSQVLAAGTGISFGYSVKHGTQRERVRQFTPLSDPILQTNGTIPDVKQVHFGNYVGQQELLRKHCELNGLDFQQYAGDQTLFPFRDKILRARERVALGIDDKIGSDVDTDPLSELSELIQTTSSDDAAHVLRM